MDWLSRKLVLWQIKKYFHLQNEQQVQVQLLGDHSITCTNLKLRNSVVNTPTAKLHIQHLTINSLSINYSSTGDEPLKLSLDGAKLVLAFNPSYVQQTPTYASTKQHLKQFFDALKSKEMLNHRGFISEEVYQLKKLMGEFFIKKVSLLIKNVDVSIQYSNEAEVHAVGCELGEVNIKQRMVINHEYNDDKEMKEEEIICTLEAVSLYLGISSEEDKIEKLAYNREILRKTKTIKKNYMLEREKIQIYFNNNKNSLTLTLSQLNFRFNKLLIVELVKITNYIQEHISDRPQLRPGKGDMKEVEHGGTRIRIREGTFQWWGFVMKRILERVEEKKQFNILTNYKYRLYLFYLIYKFTFGSNSFVDKCISDYEEKKLLQSVMSTYSMVLSRIDIIRSSEDVDEEMFYFINFVCASKIVQEICQKNGLKKVTYEKIKTAKIYFNLSNCNSFIRDFSNKSNISVALNLENSIKIQMHESKYDQIILKEGFNLDAIDFYTVKHKYITKFYKKMTEESIKWDRPFFVLQLSKMQFSKNKNETKLGIPSILIMSEDNQIAMKIRDVLLYKENKTIYASSNKIIVSQKNNYIKISSIYLNIQKILVQHLLTIKILLSQNVVEPLSEQQQFDAYLQENIYKRLPKHPFFENFSDESTNIQIKRMLIVTSVFQQNQYLTIDLNAIEYISPVSNKPPRISLDKISVSRSRLSNFQKLKTGKLDKLSIQNESLIVQNNKPLALTSNKYLRKHTGYIYYESVLDIIIPFILIQISFQDIYYVQLVINYWNQLFSNQYMFPKRKGKTQSEMKVIELKQNKIQYFQMLNTFTKSSRTRVKLEGIEVILYGQNKRSPHNQFLTMLLEGVLYENKVYILGMDTNITIFNIFIENCLGSKTFNHLKLIEIIEKKDKTDEPLIYNSKYEAQGSSLLLYGLNESSHDKNDDKDQSHMVKIKMKNQFSMKKFRKNTNIFVSFKPLFLFHSSDYYQILVNSFGLISKTAAKNVKRTFPVPKASNNQSQHQILQAKNISQKTIFVCEIEKINLIALHQNQPIYTFSFLDITAKHQTEAYVTKYQLLITQFYIVDISVNCGLHPIVIKAVPIQIFFTKYESELLKRKQKKSALLKINLFNSQLFYLNRKIKELTNFIMSHFEEHNSEQQQEKEVKNKEDELQPKTYPFCYRVELIKPVIMLLRSSLSQQKLVSEAENLLVANYLEAGEQAQMGNNFFFDASRERYNNDSFESCIQIKQQQIQFHSFAKAEEEEDQELRSQIHINLINFYIYNSLENHSNAIVFTPQIVITFADKHLRASLKTMNTSFTADEYRLLIRITQENFSETPVSYPKESIETEYKNIGFKSSYAIEELSMYLREKAQSEKFGELIISNIIGVNILYTNGEKEDIITIDKMEYESCLSNEVQKIITKKGGDHLLSHQGNAQAIEQFSKKKFITKDSLMKEFSEKFTEEVLDSQLQKQFFGQSEKFNFESMHKNEANQTVLLRGNGQERHKKQETNLNILGKWIGGMCKKCMCCCKTQQHHSDHDSVQERFQKNMEDLQRQNSQKKSLFDSDKIDLEESNIESPRQIINFSSKVNPDDYKLQLKRPYSIYMHIKGEKTREKRMYMLTQHMNIYYEKNKHIMTLIDFLNKPYAQPERPSYLKQAKFNNYRPFQMLIEVADTSIFAIHKEALNERSLELKVHTFYNLQKIGDPNNGPGKKLMETDLTFEMFFDDKKAQKRTALSDTIRLIHAKQANVSYHNRQPVNNYERLLLLGSNSKKVKFNFPIYIIKSLMDLINGLTAKPKTDNDLIVKEQNKSAVPLANKISLVEQEIQSKRNEMLLETQKSKKPKPIEKKIEETKIINNTTLKKYYIPNIQVNIETKQTVSFITLFLENTHLKNRQMSKNKCQLKNQIIDVDVNVDYWNLSLGNFQPFVEKCKFIVQQQSLKRQNSESTKLKVITKSQKDNNSHDYRNGLCINLTTALFHTYKELQLKFLLQNQKLQISNQICYDLTKKNPQVYEYMQMKKQLESQMFQGDSFLKKFPEELKNFFGRQFKIEDINELNKKKSKRSQQIKDKFHITGLKVFLYHSYLQAKSKLKFITYRTPFRIYNITPYKIQLRFRYANRASIKDKWEHEVGSKEYYSIPEDIYQCDFLANIGVNRRRYKDNNSIAEDMEGSLLKTTHIRQEQESDNTMSTKYLIQMHANKKQYHQMERHKLHQYIFNVSSLQKRLIDRRDTVISPNGLTLCLINVKSECEQLKDKTIDGQKIMLYDSLTIVMSPIIIYNYTTQNFNITNCKKKKYELQPTKSIQLNDFPHGTKISDIIIQFLEDPVHHEYDFLNREIGIKNETMLIDRNQSVNIRTIKQTYNSCLIQIYPDWLIINETQLQFHLLYEKKQFIINEKSMNSLAINEWRSKNNMTMKIRLIDDNNAQEEEFHKFGTQTDLIDMFMLPKIEDSDVRHFKQQVKKKGCCGSIKDEQLLSYPQKASDQRVFKCIQFVINIEQSLNYLLTKNLIINYKYWIVNEMEFEMIIYQYALGQTLKIDNEEENGIQIMRLKPKEQNYLYTYDFLSKQFYLKIMYEGQFVYSNLFPCNESIGRSLSLKLKRTVNSDAINMNMAYHESFHHIRIDMEQIKYTNILTFTYIDGERIKYPFYINNATNYFVKIKQNKQNFKIKPKTRIPFSWSNLVDNTHEIEVEIEGQSMTYSLKEKTYEFQPIVIKGDSIANKSNKIINSKILFKRQKCLVKWKGLNGLYLLIFDIFAKKIHINTQQSFSLSLSEAERLVCTSSKIEIYFKNREIFEFHPAQQNLKQWADLLRNFLNNNIIDKIYFTIESFENSMIYFIHNLEVSDDNDVRIDHKEYIIQNFYLSIINSNPLRIQEIILINMENIEVIFENRLSQIKQQEKNSYLIKKAQQTIKIKKFKINNQLKHALNPVILSQIKKSNYPFLQIKRQKQNLVLQKEQNSNAEQIQHYKSSIFFLDEAQLIIEAALIPQLLNFKKNIDQIQNQYSYDQNQQDKNKNQPKKAKKKVINNQIYIDYLQIKPIKMTISVSFDANIDKQFQPKLMNFLTMIPAGVENAIITIDSFMFHHVFMEESRLRQTLKQYYLYEMKKQILYNAGSIQILTPFKLIRGLGIGFTSIFYNPFYQLVNTKQIKSFTSNFLEGFITFIIFIFSLCFSVVNGLFKFIAMLTKDNNFQTKRQKFRKQIFKSPIDGFSYGARYMSRIFKQFFTNFVTWPCDFHQKMPCIGLLFGLMLSILYIIIWILKMVVTLYDFFYVIGLGFLSWGFYEQNSMKYRTRPIRTFPHKRLLPYDYLTSKGNQIMRLNLIEQNDNQEIAFISHIQTGDQSKYLLLSNYRILYCSHQLTSFKEITLYKVSRVVIGPLQKNSRTGQIQNLYLHVYLTFPDKYKCICIQCSTSDYKLKFKDLRSIKEFLQKLRQNLDKEHIDFNLQDQNMKLYQKSIENESIRKNEKVVSQSKAISQSKALS